MAFGGRLFLPVTRGEEGYRRLAAYLPSRGSRKKLIGVRYQINRPRNSLVQPGLKINRLQVWTVSRLRSLVVAVEPRVPMAEVAGSERFSVSLEPDVNTDAGSPGAVARGPNRLHRERTDGPGHRVGHRKGIGHEHRDPDPASSLAGIYHAPRDRAPTPLRQPPVYVSFDPKTPMGRERATSRFHGMIATSSQAPRAVLRQVLLDVLGDPDQRGPMTQRLFPMLLEGTPARRRLVYETLRNSRSRKKS